MINSIAKPQAAKTETYSLQCMEVWGGNQAVSTTLTLPGLDAWIFSRPDGGADGGGDVHYASSCASGALSRMLVADVAGHGNEASDAAHRLRKMMQRHINQHKQTKFVRSVNREFSEFTRNGRFATAIAFSYDAPINRLQICNAGHPAPLVYRSASRTWSYLESRREFRANNFPLGIDGVGDYEQFDSLIAVGDMILCYTDGLIECRLKRDPNGKARLEREGLLETVRRIDVAEPGRIIDELVKEVDEEAAIEDDLTIVLFRANGTRPYVPLWEKIVTPLRFLRGHFRTFLRR